MPVKGIVGLASLAMVAACAPEAPKQTPQQIATARAAAQEQANINADKAAGRSMTCKVGDETLTSNGDTSIAVILSQTYARVTPNKVFGGCTLRQGDNTREFLAAGIPEGQVARAISNFVAPPPAPASGKN